MKRRTGVKKTCLIYSDDEEKVPGFDYYIKKPFLPTEMVDLMSEIHDDLLLPEMETESEEMGMEEGVPEMAAPAEKEVSGEGEIEKAEEETREQAGIVGMEDFDTLLEELEAESHEEEKASESVETEEDFEALMASLELEQGEEEAVEERGEAPSEVAEKAEEPVSLSEEGAQE